MCYRNGYSFSGCGQCEQKVNRYEESNCKGMTRQDFYEALKVLEAICRKLEPEIEDYDDYEEDPILMIAVAPGKAPKLITEDEAEEFLPCFGEDDVIEEVPDVGLIMSYNGQLLFRVGDQKYLDGPALIYDLDEDGEVMPVTAEDFYRVQKMLESRTLYVTGEDDRMPVISLN